MRYLFSSRSRHIHDVGMTAEYALAVLHSGLLEELRRRATSPREERLA